MTVVTAAHLIGNVVIAVLFYYVGYYDGGLDAWKDMDRYIAERKDK